MAVVDAKRKNLPNTNIFLLFGSELVSCKSPQPLWQLPGHAAVAGPLPSVLQQLTLLHCEPSLPHPEHPIATLHDLFLQCWDIQVQEVRLLCHILKDLNGKPHT